jgi:hypothetical protein
MLERGLASFRTPRARSAVLAIASVSVVALLLAAAVPAQAAVSCRVRNARTDVAYRSLVRAIRLARAGDSLRIHGVCHGSGLPPNPAFEIGKNLTLRGISTPTSGPATLDAATPGGDQLQSVVLVDRGVSVTLRGLVIRRGWVDGIHAERGAHVKIVDSSVRANSQGGVYADGGVTLIRDSRIVSNGTYGVAAVEKHHGVLRIERSVLSGNVNGAPILAEYASVMMTDSSVRSNYGTYSGGMAFYKSTVTIRGSTIVHNVNLEGPDTDGTGGGMSIDMSIVVLIDSSLRNNDASSYGGGVYIRGDPYGVLASSLTLAGHSVIQRNTSGTNGWGAVGGGVAVDGGATVSAADGTSDVDPITGKLLPVWTGRISDNTPDDCAELGGTVELICG